MGRITAGLIFGVISANAAYAGTLTNPGHIEIQEPKLEKPVEVQKPRGGLLILAIQAATAAKGG
ncbi:MAG: hypothetical protein AAF429_15145 [Pseudomonadota bacterium]